MGLIVAARELVLDLGATPWALVAVVLVATWRRHARASTMLERAHTAAWPVARRR